MNKKMSFICSLIVLLISGCGGDNISSSLSKSPAGDSSSSVSSPVISTTSTTISTSTISSSNIIEEFIVDFMVDGKPYYQAKVKEGEKLIKPADPTKDGYNFVRWCSDELLEYSYNFDTPVTSSFTLYAEFEEQAPERYTITFDANGGILNSDETQVVIEGMLVTKPADPTKDGYNFIGWSLEKDSNVLYNFSIPVVSSFTLYATYEEIKVDALFNITSSSDESFSKRADFAVDGNTDTYWKASSTSTQTLTIDLEEVKEVSYVSQEFNDLNTWNFVIEGSIDNENYATLYSNDSSTSGQKFETDVNGFYRYIRLTIEDSGIVATSREFNVVANTIEKGINIAYGMKGVADCHAPGCEPERMFDGNEGNYHCSAGGLHENHYMGMDANKVFFVTYIEVLFQDAVDHKFYVDARLSDGSWVELDGGNYRENTENIGVLKLDVNKEISAVLLHHNGNSTGNWPAIREFKVFGFESYANQINHEVVENKEIYDMGSLSYVNRLSLNNKTSTNRKIEISKDNVNWEEISLENIDGEYILVNKEARYIRYNDNSSELGLGNLNIFATKYETNLAMLLNPVATTRSGDAGYWENMMTFNSDCAQASGRFYCSSDYALEEIITLDLNNPCIVNTISYKWQDAVVDPVYRLIIEVSLDGENYTTLLNNTEGASGQTFVCETTNNNKLIQYVRITAQNTAGFTNCNTLEIMGYGSTK